MILAYPRYLSDAFRFSKCLKGNNDWPPIKAYPILLERQEPGGTAKGQYFHQDLWVARELFKDKPEKHIDVGSRVDGFVAHVASFREIEVFDIRPINVKIKNIRFIQADFMSENFELIDYCDSLSCLHALEHFGLGRYGDPLDINGHIKGFENLTKILKSGGTFYFSVPLGKQRIEFNAHRIFSIKYLLNLFSKKFKIEKFSYIDDLGDMHEDILLTEENINNNLNCNLACGIFKLIKI